MPEVEGDVRPFTLKYPTQVFQRVRPISHDVFLVEAVAAGTTVRLGVEQSYFNQLTNREQKFTLWSDSQEKEPQYFKSDDVMS